MVLLSDPADGTMAHNQRKALMMGRGDPLRDSDGSANHPQRAKMTFLRWVGNLENDPAKGWTCDMEWDLKVRLGMDPTNTPENALQLYWPAPSWLPHRHELRAYGPDRDFLALRRG